MIPFEEGLRRALECRPMLYNRKSWIPDDQRDAELRWLYRLAAEAPDGPAVECGVYWGGSFVCWTCAREGRGEFIAVDNWASKCEAIFRHNIARYGLEATVITAEARDAPALIPSPVAFAFIDSEHGEMGIPHDIQVWPGAIMPGGIIAFHDYGTAKGVVKREVDAWQAQAGWELLGMVGSTIAFRRPGK